MAEVITDHALVRFIERVKGVSLEEYRKELSNILDATTEWGRDPKPQDDGFLMVVEGGTLITILPAGTRGKKRDKYGYTRFATLPTPPERKP